MLTGDSPGIEISFHSQTFHDFMNYGMSIKVLWGTAKHQTLPLSAKEPLKNSEVPRHTDVPPFSMTYQSLKMQTKAKSPPVVIQGL
jgi:hypothetical protein